MTDRAEKSWKIVGTVASVIAVVVVVVGFVYSQSYDGRISTNEENIKTLQTDVKQHKDNSSIHRTTEEARAVEKADAEFRDFVKTRLSNIESKVDNLERRVR